MLKRYLKSWWKWLKYEPGDPRHFAGKTIKIAVIGGGSGLATLLRGLRKYSDDISAIVAVTDDGASSGVLREELGILPPGDIRKCISALSHNEEIVSALMEYRFKKGNNRLSGHALGNIWLAALTEYFGSFEMAVETTTRIFKTAGKVLPATLNNVGISALYEDGSEVRGESSIPKVGKKIKRVMLDRKNIHSYKKAALAIESSDLIVIGPGSLYTSVIPNLLISGIRNSIIANKEAVKIYIANCSTERGETENYTVLDHLLALEKHGGKKLFEYCLVNNRLIKESKKSFRLGEVNNITTDKKKILDYQIILRNVVDESNPLYHDSEKLAKSVIEIYNSRVSSK